MKKRRGEAREERRKDRVEINLLAEDEGSYRTARAKRRRGCSLPFLGGAFLGVSVLWLRVVLG